ncbi:thiamine phosphate synthase [Galbibacter sp. BG1]
MKIDTIQYISQGNTPTIHLQNIQKVCECGGRWIQLRLKNKTPKEVLETAIKAKEICQQYSAKLIINDHVEVANVVNADGVHLGKEDMCPQVARKILGKEKIIGGTANTSQDIEKLIKKGVDYIGLGPFRHTNTKEKLSPILGIKGYKNIFFELNKKTKTTPIIAIGGIVKEDIEELKLAGIYGVAMSGYLTSEIREIKTHDLTKRLDVIKEILNQKTINV